MTRGPRYPEASDSEAGPVQLCTDGEVAARKAVTGADSRLVQRVTSNPVGVEGQFIFRGDLEEPFYYDASRSRWVSLRTLQAAWTSQAAAAIGVYLRTFQAPVGSATQGIALAWDAVLVEAYAWQASAGAATQFNVNAGGALAASYALGVGEQAKAFPGLDVAFSSGAVVSVNMGVALGSGGGILLVFRRRAT